MTKRTKLEAQLLQSGAVLFEVRHCVFPGDSARLQEAVQLAARGEVEQAPKFGSADTSAAEFFEGLAREVGLGGLQAEGEVVRNVDGECQVLSPCRMGGALAGCARNRAGPFLTVGVRYGWVDG